MFFPICAQGALRRLDAKLYPEVSERPFLDIEKNCATLLFKPNHCIVTAHRTDRILGAAKRQIEFVCASGRVLESSLDLCDFSFEFVRVGVLERPILPLPTISPSSTPPTWFRSWIVPREP